MISMALASCTPRFLPYYALGWLLTVHVTNKVDGKLTNYKICLASFTIAKKWQNELTSYLCLKFVFLSVWFILMYGLILYLIKINDDRNDQNNCVMKNHSWFWLDQGYNLLDSIRMFWYFFVIDLMRIFCNSNGEKLCRNNDYFPGFGCIKKLLRV